MKLNAKCSKSLMKKKMAVATPKKKNKTGVENLMKDLVMMRKAKIHQAHQNLKNQNLVDQVQIKFQGEIWAKSELNKISQQVMYLMKNKKINSWKVIQMQ